MEELKDKWNFRASKTIIDTVIKKSNLTANRNAAAHNVDNHANNWSIVDNISVLLFGDLCSNS